VATPLGWPVRFDSSLRSCFLVLSPDTFLCASPLRLSPLLAHISLGSSSGSNLSVELLIALRPTADFGPGLNPSIKFVLYCLACSLAHGLARQGKAPPFFPKKLTPPFWRAKSRPKVPCSLQYELPLPLPSAPCLVFIAWCIVSLYNAVTLPYTQDSSLPLNAGSLNSCVASFFLFLFTVFRDRSKILRGFLPQAESKCSPQSWCVTGPRSFFIRCGHSRNVPPAIGS